MKLTLVMVTSLDGRSTRGKEFDNHTWTSPEDQMHFQQVVQSAHLIIMGSTTYDAAREGMQHRDDLLRIVLTRDPSQYKSDTIPGKLEFSNETPTELITRLEKEGHEEGYLVGGAHTNTAFFKEGLITELWQTLEPTMLGVGNGIIGEESVHLKFELLSFEKLNEIGTLLLKYRPLKG